MTSSRYGQLVAEYDSAVFVQIDDRGQVRLIQSEKVEESAVLPETVAVVGVVHGALGISEQQDQPRFQPGLQLVPARHVGFPGKHGHVLSRIREVTGRIV